ncbi:hypothetical protein PG996_001675 [Apiospora saccharicola]|uniref:Uncharacterized protein n=1 Tax=Apiospora saccharicola TaxID=335842 RepID=A0ABR1WL99_9PEZI
MVVPKSLRAVAATLALLPLSSTAAVVHQQKAQDLQVLQQEPYSDNTTIVWYASTSHAQSQSSRRAVTTCGDNLVTCTSKALARADACSGLFGYLSDKGSTAPPRDSVAVCWVDPEGPSGNNQCCTAWRQWNSGIVMGYLLGAATKTWNQCKTGGGLVGGVTNDVSLNGVCQSQCLGNTRECF